VEFERAGHRYIVKRFRGHPEWGNRVQVICDAQALTDQDTPIAAANAMIETLVGCSPDVFRRVALFVQRDWRRFTSLTDTEQKTFLEEATGLTLLSACSEIVRDWRRTAQARLERLAGEIDALDRSIKEMTEATAKQREDIEARLRAIGDEERQIRTALTGANAEQTLADGRAAVTMLEERVRSLEVQLRQFEEWEGACPTCRRPLTKDEFEALVAEPRQRLTESLESLRLAKAVLKEREAAAAKERALRQRLSEVVAERQAVEQMLPQQSITKDLELGLSIRQRQKMRIEQRQLALLDYWDEALSPRGLRAVALSGVLATVAERARLYLSDVGATALAPTFEWQKGRLVQRFGSASYATLSGGEKQLVDLCVGLAVRDAVEQFAGWSCDVLALDEPAEGLDMRFQANLQRLLRRLSERKGTVLLITHQSGYEELFHRVYVVGKVNGMSSMRRR